MGFAAIQWNLIRRVYYNRLVYNSRSLRRRRRRRAHSVCMHYTNSLENCKLMYVLSHAR